MNHLSVRTEPTFAGLLELAANNDIEGFKEVIDQDPSCMDEIGTWYIREKGYRRIVPESRTPLMVAAVYGSIDVVKLILSLSVGDVNQSCGSDGSTALHCAASGGSVNAALVVKLLLLAGADPDMVDSNGLRPVDVIAVPPKFSDLQFALEELLSTNSSVSEHDARVSPTAPNSVVQNGFLSMKLPDMPVQSASEKKEYPVDPSLPDIKNSIYATDEFRMFSFKIRPCSRAYSHDWTECPFVHPGENARRRDPRKFHYSCVPCPDFRKGACRRGDMCEYAHGVFECWLHPAQYRTRLCKDGTNCNRRVCFFAHTPDELRPLYVSTGSAVPSPRSGSVTAMDIAAAMSLLPGSPSVSVMSPSPFTPPMSPSACSISQASGAWAQQNVPMLHLPGSNLQSSRLRSSFNARDIPVGDYNLLPDEQMLNEISYITQPCAASTRSVRSKNMNPSNLDDLFSTESLSPRYSDQSLAASMYSPTHKSALLNQFQQQQSMLSPINTNFSPKSIDHPLMQSPFAVHSSGRMSPRNADPISPMSSRVSVFAQPDNQIHFRSHSSRDLGSNSSALFGSPSNSWSKWGATNGKPDWTVGADELGKLRRSSSFELGHNGEEPDLSWVQSLVKESTPESNNNSEIIPGVDDSACTGDDSLLEPVDHSILGAWLEQMQLDQLAAK